MRKLHASTVYLTMGALMSFANSTMFTTYALYYVSGLGLNPLQLVLVGTALELTILLLEVPTGVVADTYSRRLSVIIGMFIVGIAYVTEGSLPLFGDAMASYAVPLFAGVLLAEVIRGVGETFISGAHQAWITDEIGENNVGQIFLKSNQMNQAAHILGVITSVALSSAALNLPYVFGGIVYLLLALFLWFGMQETNFQRAEREEISSLRHAASTFKEGLHIVRGRPILLALLFVSFFTGAGSEGFDRLWEANFIMSLHFPEIGRFTPAVWFGIISVTAGILCFMTAWIARKRLDTGSPRTVARSMFVFTAIRLGFILAFSFSGSFTLAFVFFLLSCMAGTIAGPMYDTWLNQNVDSRARATVLSMTSQTNALGQSLGGPVVGAVATRYMISSGLALAALMQAPILAVFYKAQKHAKPSGEHALERSNADAHL